MATYKHLRSSTANKRPTTTIADGQFAINTNTASPGLFFKDSAGTGIVKVGPVHVGTTAPNSVPASGGSTGNYTGEQWLDTSVSPAQMKVWNGSTWVGIVADELPVSKLQDGAARQLIQTDAAGTGVEWTSNVDVPGTLDVTGATTLDSTLSVAGVTSIPLGSAAAPSLAITGDPNSGLYSPGADQVAISTNGTGRLFVDSTGRVGIGITGSAYMLDVDGGAATPSRISTTVNWNFPNLTLRRNASNISTAKMLTMLLQGDSDSDTVLTNQLNIWGTYSGTPTTGSTTAGLSGVMNLGAPSAIASHVNGSERARIDSSGRLLVGTSTARANFFNSTVSPLIQQEGVSGSSRFASITYGSNAEDDPIFILGKHRGASVGGTTIVNSGDGLGKISFQGSDGTEFVESAAIRAVVDGTPGANDMPGRLVFATTADGASSPTERARITSGGYFKASNDGNYVGATAGYHELRQTAGTGTLILEARNTSATGNGIQVDVNSDGTAYAYLIGYSLSAAANRIIIWSNGNVVNTNNSYGAISDIKLKENIVDANSQWDDLKALQVRNYNFKEGQTHTQIGLVAQEAELISPGLVTESPDRDEDGNDLGTTTKSVNYSVLYMKAVKALQEAMERIETLEAKVAALEGV